MKFTLGCDPEILLTKQDQFFAAVNTFGGTKDQPRPLMALGEGFFVQEDNVALEFNIPPSESSQAFTENLKKIVSYLADNAKAAFDLDFSAASAAIYPADQLVDPRTLEFGCDPDYNAWTGEVNMSPMGMAHPNLRSAGGHLHLGLPELSEDNKRRIVQLMDLHLGVPSVIMDNGELRKQLYGKCGAMRYKPYGLEYRTLSNFWIFGESLSNWAWNATEKALCDFEHGRDPGELRELITSTINTNNRVAAAEMVAEHHLLTL
jgi:hypothetical protein